MNEQRQKHTGEDHSPVAAAASPATGRSSAADNRRNRCKDAAWESFLRASKQIILSGLTLLVACSLN